MSFKLKFPISFGPVTVVPTEPEHLAGFWDILQGWDDFWADRGLIDSLDHFRQWYRETARDSLTGLENGQVIGGAYLQDITLDSTAYANVFKRKGYLNPKLVAAVVKTAIPYWFEKYDLESLRGITRQRSAIALAIRMGFKRDGRLRHWSKVRGEWTDYTILSILRGDL